MLRNAIKNFFGIVSSIILFMLVIITGPSHVGKTTAVKELLGYLPIRTAVLALDTVLRAFRTDPNHPDTVLDTAYDLLVGMVCLLLERGFVVVVESTFTLVRATGEVEMYTDRLEQLRAVAGEHSLSASSVALMTDWATVQHRADRLQRLDRGIVQAIWRAHADTPLPGCAYLDVRNVSPAATAAMVARHLGTSLPNT